MTWKDDLSGNNRWNEDDVILDSAVDRALGNARLLEDEESSLRFQIEIADSPLRAVVLDWDLEVWGRIPEGFQRGKDGAGYRVGINVGDITYYENKVGLFPGRFFDTEYDRAQGEPNTTLIDGNEYALRNNSSGIVEVNSDDGAIGNFLTLEFDANWSDDDAGWIQAIDNVVLRTLAAGDAQGDGDVDPVDIVQLLAAGVFGQGNIDATWAQGDFDNDGDFDGTDILMIVQGLAGEFPKTYAHTRGNGVPDYYINPATGNITFDTDGSTIGSIIFNSAAGIFDGPNSPSWDVQGDFAQDTDFQISMPLNLADPGFTGIDDLGDGVIGDLPPGFNLFQDITATYLDTATGEIRQAECLTCVPEPSSLILLGLGGLGLMLAYYRRMH